MTAIKTNIGTLPHFPSLEKRFDLAKFAPERRKLKRGWRGARLRLHPGRVARVDRARVSWPLRCSWGHVMSPRDKFESCRPRDYRLRHGVFRVPTRRDQTMSGANLDMVVSRSTTRRQSRRRTSRRTIPGIEDLFPRTCGRTSIAGAPSLSALPMCFVRSLRGTGDSRRRSVDRHGADRRARTTIVWLLRVGRIPDGNESAGCAVTVLCRTGTSRQGGGANAIGRGLDWPWRRTSHQRAPRSVRPRIDWLWDEAGSAAGEAARSCRRARHGQDDLALALARSAYDLVVASTESSCVQRFGDVLIFGLARDDLTDTLAPRSAGLPVRT